MGGEGSPFPPKELWGPGGGGVTRAALAQGRGRCGPFTDKKPEARAWEGGWLLSDFSQESQLQNNENNQN